MESPRHHGEDQQREGSGRREPMIRVILQVELGCCQGCRDRIERKLRREEGVEGVQLEEEKGVVTVWGGGAIEAEAILERVRKTKRASKLVSIELVEPPREQPLAAGSGGAPVEAVAGAPAAEVEAEAPGPVPRPPAPAPGAPAPASASASASTSAAPTPAAAGDEAGPQRIGQNLVQERLYPERDGTRFRTRVSASLDDGLMCVTIEETTFFVDRSTSPSVAAARHIRLRPSQPELLCACNRPLSV